MTTPRLEAGHTLPQKTTFSLPCALRRRGPWGGGGGGRGDAPVQPRGAPKLLGPKQGSAPGAGHLSAPPCPVRGRRRPPRPGRRPATGDGRPARSEAKEARPGRRETTPAPGRNHRCAGDTWPASVEARPGAGPAASIGRAPGGGPGPADTADTDLLSVTREWRAPPASTSEPEAAPPGGAMCEPARKYMFCPESPPPPFPPWHALAPFPMSSRGGLGQEVRHELVQLFELVPVPAMLRRRRNKSRAWCHRQRSVLPRRRSRPPSFGG